MSFFICLEKGLTHTFIHHQNLGMAVRATLEGVLKGNDSLTRNIKVTLGGIFTVNCKVFVDNALVFSNR